MGVAGGECVGGVAGGRRAWRKSAEMRMETTDPASRVGGVSGWWTYSISHSKMCTWRRREGSEGRG